MNVARCCHIYTERKNDYSRILLRPVSITAARYVGWRAIVTSPIKRVEALQRYEG